jgi:hypothetical protein
VRKTVFERWREKVDMKGPDDCWEWLAHRDCWGYGQFKVNRKTMFAHRFSFAHYKNNEQSIPSNLYVCHHCDNPGCVNPNHLFLGTHTDNMKDMVRKGRRANPKPKKHTDEEVAKIRLDYASGLSLSKVAKLNNTVKSLVWNIVHQKPPYER